MTEASRTETRKYWIGDACLCWSLGDTIDSSVSTLVLRIFSLLKEKQHQGKLDVLDIVPSYNALAIYFDPAVCEAGLVEASVDCLIETASAGKENVVAGPESVIHRVITVYDGEDLPRVAKINELTVARVIELHQKPTYRVAMVGFLPHFPYLIGLDTRLETPRLDSPRTRVPAGSVAIGGAQTGIYPRESPGGWNIIGRADPERLKTVNPGDSIIFEKSNSI